ncbi:MAG: hypothetical protein AB1938_30835 [Myxococcota bacterium]
MRHLLASGLLSLVTLSACQSTSNPCATLCSEAPPSECVDSQTLRTFTAATTCDEGCMWLVNDRRCDVACRDGACVAEASGGGSGGGGGATGGGSGGGGGGGNTGGGSGSCDGVTCSAPPANACADASTLRIYESSGTCSAGQCSYASRTEACTGGCVNGACVNNPCQGVTCNTPPASRCFDANTLVVASPTGTCSAGTCRYAESMVPCQFGCANDACVNDPCAGRTCNQPPATFCLSATTLRSYQTAGTCSGGSCLYQPTDSTCTFGCANGACANDPCAGRTCNQPPASACVTPTTLRTFAASGVCSGGACTYAPSDTTCQHGCVNGACANDPCAGVSCNTPPANSCLNPTTLRTWTTPGACAGGACNYLPQDTTCQFGCVNGACANDPCAGVSCNSPPAASCASGSTLRTFLSPGTCSGGACSYTPQDTTCQFGCVNGACANDPCAGVSCTMPPAAACVTPTTLRTFAPSGVCSGGACSYAPTDATCQFGCANGRCNGDPCQGVSCTTPPARTCVNGAARVYSPSGTCSGGACSYAYTDTLCTNGCANGVCNPPACGGVTCNTPPAPTCTSANRLRTYFPLGTCAASTCSYTAYDVDCSQGCINGACIAGSWTLESTPYGSTLENGNGVLDADGEPVLAGCDNGAVKVRRRTPQGWREETVDTAMGACEAKVALDATGEPLVAYTDAINRDLRFAMRNGGTWTPKELIANQGDVGMGLSLAVTAAGVPLVTYRAPGTPAEVRMATRLNGAWTEEVIASQAAALTELRLVNGAPTVLLPSTPNTTIATKNGTSWSLTTTPVGNGSLSVLRSSFQVVQGTPRFFGNVSNPLNSYQSWRLRQVDGPGAFRDESLYSDVPLAFRADGPPAVFLRRGSSPSTPVIRVRKNDAWEQLISPVPWGTSFGVPMLYTGNTRHVLVDTYARRLLSPPGACVPQCGGRTCGDDGCGGSCGTCASGACAPTGVCSAFTQVTMPGWSPSRALLGAGTTVQAIEVSYSSYVESLHRVQTASGWAALASGLGNTAAVGGVNPLPIDAANNPLVLLNGTIGGQAGAHLARKSGASWTTELISSTQGGAIVQDSAGTISHVACSTTQVTLRTRPASGVFGAPVTVWTRPSGNDGMYCGNLVATPSGALAMPVTLSYWVGSPTYATRYTLAVLTNESGSWSTLTVATNLVNYASGTLRVDSGGTMYVLSSDFRVRPAGGSFAVEALPPTMPSTIPGTTALELDRMGAVHLAWVTGYGTAARLTLARRTGAGTWSEDTAPLLSTVDSGLGQTAALFGLTFDAANKAQLLVDDASTYRALSK